MSNSNTPPEPQQEPTTPQVSTKKRFAWGLGGFSDCMMYQGVNGLIDPIYNIGMGIDARIIGLARSIPRFADIFIDPAIGHVSDNTRSRWGRRSPWMLAGALIAAIIAIAMWFLPDWREPLFSVREAIFWGDPIVFDGRSIFMVIMMVLLFTFGYSLFTIPYTGQGYELTTDYTERTHLFKWRQYAYAVAGFLTPWLLPLCVKLDILFYGIAADKANGTHGIQWVGMLVGILILVTALGPILFSGKGKTAHTGEEKVSFFHAIAFTMKNLAFWPLVLGNFMYKFCGAVTGCFFMYLMIYKVSQGNMDDGSIQLAVFFNLINIASFFAMAPVVHLINKFDKKPALLGLMLASAAVYATVYYTFQPISGWTADVANWMSQNLHISYSICKAWPVYLSGIGIGIFCNCMPLLINSMLADVCDVDELKSGHQRQAFYGAAFVTTDKIAMGVAMLMQGFLLEASGFQKGVFVGDPVESMAYWMKALMLTQPVGFLLGFVCILFYPITRAKAAETRRLLDQRATKNP